MAQMCFNIDSVYKTWHTVHLTYPMVGLCTEVTATEQITAAAQLIVAIRLIEKIGLTDKHS